MKDNHLALLIVAFGVVSAIWQGGSALSVTVALAVTACAFSGLYGATGYRAHRFFVLSLILSGATLLWGRVAL